MQSSRIATLGTTERAFQIWNWLLYCRRRLKTTGEDLPSPVFLHISSGVSHVFWKSSPCHSDIISPAHPPLGWYKGAHTGLFMSSGIILIAANFQVFAFFNSTWASAGVRVLKTLSLALHLGIIHPHAFPSGTVDSAHTFWILSGDVSGEAVTLAWEMCSYCCLRIINRHLGELNPCQWLKGTLQRFLKGQLWRQQLPK